MTTNVSQKRLDRMNRVLGKGAAERFSPAQTLFLWIFLLAILAVALFAPDGILLVARVAVGFGTFFYVASLVFLLRAMVTGQVNDPTIRVSDKKAKEANIDWPKQVHVIPLYHEAGIVKQLNRVLKLIEYPLGKLVIFILVESGDLLTLQALENYIFPEYVHIVVRPANEVVLKNKPSAIVWLIMQKFFIELCAGAVLFNIWDAEDRPEPLQLKKAALAYLKASQQNPQVAGVQAQLVFNNDTTGLSLWKKWLVSMQVLDYARYFLFMLPGYAAMKVFVPLCGTSNYLRFDIFMAYQFDIHNMTEDGELGTRLVRDGWRIIPFESQTFEEAVETTKSFVNQRSRWYKGGLQTFVTHTRHPAALLQDTGALGFIAFVLIEGGAILSSLINPFFWGLTLLYAITHAEFIQTLYPGSIFHIAYVCFLFGNFANIYIIALSAIKTKRYSLVFFAIFSPLYWALMSLAGYKALYEFCSDSKLHAWSKTEHVGVKQPSSIVVGGD